MRNAIYSTLGAVTLLAATTARAQDADESAPTADQLVLGHHLFQAPALQASAFMTTHFGMSQTVQSIHVPDAPVTPNTTRDVDAIGVGENVNFGVQLFKRLEGYATLDARA